MPRTARRPDAPSEVTKWREPNAYLVPLPPRASSAPNATKRTGSAAGCCLSMRASSIIVVTPDALSSAPGDCGTVSRWAPITTCGRDGSKPGGSATTLTGRPAGTRTPTTARRQVERLLGHPVARARSCPPTQSAARA